MACAKPAVDGTRLSTKPSLNGDSHEYHVNGACTSVVPHLARSSLRCTSMIYFPLPIHLKKTSVSNSSCSPNGIFRTSGLPSLDLESPSNAKATQYHCLKPLSSIASLNASGKPMHILQIYPWLPVFNCDDRTNKFLLTL